MQLARIIRHLYSRIYFLVLLQAFGMYQAGASSPQNAPLATNIMHGIMHGLCTKTENGLFGRPYFFSKTVPSAPTPWKPPVWEAIFFENDNFDVLLYAAEQQYGVPRCIVTVCLQILQANASQNKVPRSGII